MLNSVDIFSSSGTVLSIDEKEFGKKRITIVIQITEVRKLMHLEIKGLFQYHRAGSKAKWIS